MGISYKVVLFESSGIVRYWLPEQRVQGTKTPAERGFHVIECHGNGYKKWEGLEDLEGQRIGLWTCWDERGSILLQADYSRGTLRRATKEPPWRREKNEAKAAMAVWSLPSR